MRAWSCMCYPKAVRTMRKAVFAGRDCLRRAILSPEIIAGGCDFFDALPDDLVLSVLSKLSSTAECPADFITVLMTCRRLNRLGLNPVVLYTASGEVVVATRRSEYYHRFLKRCADTGNPVASAYYNLLTGQITSPKDLLAHLQSLGEPAEQGRKCLGVIYRKIFALEPERP